MSYTPSSKLVPFAQRAALSLLLPGALSACSLVQLSDDIEQGNCRSDADCAVLNDDARLDEDPCRRWQCDDTTKLCAYGPLDADHDGQTPGTVAHEGELVSCDTATATRDCDDDDDSIGAGFDELCDDKDNDCDGLSDEAALIAQQRSIAVLGDDELVTDVAYARDRTTGELALATGLEQPQGLRPALALVDAQLDSAASLVPLTWPGVAAARAENVAIAPLDASAYVYAALNTAGTRRVMAGIVRAGASMVDAEPDDPLAQQGLRCFELLGCGYVLEPAVATQGSHALITYLRADEPIDGAGCDATDADVHVLANLVLAPAGGAPLQERTEQAVYIGATRDLSPPAVVALPPASQGASATDYLVAHADAEGRMVVRHVTRDGDALETAVPVPITEASMTVPASAASFAWGADAEGPLLGIAFVRGCGVEATVTFRTLRPRRQSDGELTIDMRTDVEVGGGVAQAAPALAYSAERGTWAVSFRDKQGLRTRVLESDGTLHGDEPYLLIENGDGADARAVLLTPAVLSTPGGFGVVAHVSHGGGEARSFEGVRLTCE